MFSKKGSDKKRNPCMPGETKPPGVKREILSFCCYHYYGNDPFLSAASSEHSC